MGPTTVHFFPHTPRLLGDTSRSLDPSPSPRSYTHTCTQTSSLSINVMCLYRSVTFSCVYPTLRHYIKRPRGTETFTKAYDTRVCIRGVVQQAGILTWTPQMAFLTGRGWTAVPCLLSQQNGLRLPFQALYCDTSSPSEIKPPEGFLAFQEILSPSLLSVNVTDTASITTEQWHEKENPERPFRVTALKEGQDRGCFPEQ